MEKIIPSPANLCSRYAEKMISVKITSRCNANCAFCIDKGGYRFDESKFDVDKLSEKIVIGHPDFTTVIVTGGEPSLVLQDRTLPLLAEIWPWKKRTVLNTNGTLVSVAPGPCAMLDECIDELQISIHTPDEVANRRVFGVPDRQDLIQIPTFDAMRRWLDGPRKYSVSVNACFTKQALEYERARPDGKPFVQAMVDLCGFIGADKLRLTELKRVSTDQYVRADNFEIPWLMGKTDEELVTRGCTDFAKIGKVTVSVKRVCKYARGTDAKAFSCCFVDRDGQDKIEGIEHVDSTFRVIYGDGTETTDWIF